MKRAASNTKNQIILVVIVMVCLVGIALYNKSYTPKTISTSNIEAPTADADTEIDTSKNGLYASIEKDLRIESTDKVEQPAQAEQTSEWPVIYSLQEAASLTVVVNKKHKLPSEYAPGLQSVAGGQMRPDAAAALSTMLDAAANAGVSMRIISSYRSYSTQVATYNKWVNLQGKAQADRSSARPGHSEHQTGLAVDLGTPDNNCDLLICFGTTAQGKWLAANSHKYGFIVRYESDTESTTGYQYEPWHMRYLGVDAATAVKNSGQTLDQYYGVAAGGY
jgi:D-alanyl-D-alanine carboxypeptidase